jgi:hypothetical protein
VTCGNVVSSAPGLGNHPSKVFASSQPFPASCVPYPFRPATWLRAVLAEEGDQTHAEELRLPLGGQA